MARSFSASLSGPSGNRADVVVRRVHRERRHALSIDLWGLWDRSSVKDLERAVSERLPVTRTAMTKFQYV